MTQDLSSLMDGELDATEADRIITGCCRSPENTATWQAYHLIGDVLRGDSAGRAGSTDRIISLLAQEPTVLSPRKRFSQGAGRIAFAAAASVATIAAVGWIGFTSRGAPDMPLAARDTAADVVPVSATAQPPMNVNDYLVAHRQMPASDVYRAVANRPAAGARP
jgi:sigma-E factor negative regulatory protein RseA